MEKASRSRQASIAARAMLGFYRVALIVATLIAAVGTVIAIFVNQTPDLLTRITFVRLD